MLNKKGTSLIEVIISIALISIVLVFMIRLLIDLNNEENNNEYAVNNHNCLLSPVKDSYSLYYNMKKCIEEDDLRYRLAENGQNDVKKLNWEDSVNQFSEFLKGIV